MRGFHDPCRAGLQSIAHACSGVALVVTCSRTSMRRLSAVGLAPMTVPSAGCRARAEPLLRPALDAQLVALHLVRSFDGVEDAGVEDSLEDLDIRHHAVAADEPGRI